MSSTIRIFLLALTIAVSAAATAQPATRSAITPDFFGINGVCLLHYRDAPDSTATALRRMDAIERAGAACDRTDFWWSLVQPERGRWDWSVTDRAIALLTEHGVRPLPILSYHAAWSKDSPTTAGAIADYAEYVRRAVARYRGRVHEWEVWNEPNIETFWSPRPDVDAYARLLAAAYAAAKKSDPGCTVVACATSMTDIEFMREVGKRGGFRNMDVLSFHPYPLADGPEEMDLHRQIRNVRRVAADFGRPDMPLWITEMGWKSDVNKPDEVRRQAAYMVMAHVIAAAEGVQRLYWFNLQDWIENGELIGWGMISPDWRDKGTIPLYREMTRMLTGARYAGVVPCAGASVYAFKKGEQWLLVAWANRGKSPVLHLPAPASLTGIDGKVAGTQSADVRLTTSPVYLTLPLSTKLELAAGPPAREGILVNPSFEELETTKPYGWDMGHFSGGRNLGVFEVEEGNAADGRRAASLRATKDAAWESWPLPVYPGEEITLTGRIRARDAGGVNQAQIVFMGGAGWRTMGGPKSDPVSGTTDWRDFRATGTVPEGATMARISLSSRDNPGTVSFDALNVEITDAPAQ